MKRLNGSAHNYIDHWSNIRPTMVQGGRVGEKFYWNVRRLDPITKQYAFRDEATSTIFDEQKINDQLDQETQGQEETQSQEEDELPL